MFVYELFKEEKSLRNSNPCWKGYHPVGTKKKNGKTVPNCVPVNEDSDTHEAIQSAIIRRIMTQHKEALAAHGPVVVMNAAEEVANNIGDVDEIGTSDVSIWTQQALELCKQIGRT